MNLELQYGMNHKQGDMVTPAVYISEAMSSIVNQEFYMHNTT